MPAIACWERQYPLGPAYLGKWGHKKGVRRLAAARELDWSVAYMAGKIKFQIWHLYNIYLCQNFILFMLNLMYLYI